MTVSGIPIPDDLVLVGYVSGAYGINGWIRIKPFSSGGDALLAAKTWWVDKPEMHDVEMMQSKLHVDEVVASLMGVVGRDAAEALKGATVHVRRSHFPALDNDEFYWVDLIGLAVVNERGESLGVVGDLMDNGAHPILRVGQPAACKMGWHGVIRGVVITIHEAIVRIRVQGVGHPGLDLDAVLEITPLP